MSATISVLFENSLLVLSLLMIVMLLASLYYLEKQKIRTEEIVIVALLSAIAASGRIIFSGIPSVQPSSFIIILSGVSYGPTIGLFVGIITAFSSNLILGQGPWTVWQMFFWGCMGFVAGFFRLAFLKSKMLLICYGFFWGFLFGWGMNLWFAWSYSPKISIKVLLAAGITSFPMDLAHAISNLLLLLFAAKSLLKRFCRIGIKYGIMPLDNEIHDTNS